MAVRNVARNAQVIQKQQEEKVVTPRSLKLARSINMPAKSISSVKVRAAKKERIAPPINNSKKASGTENSAADPKDSKKKSLKPSSLKERKLEVNGKESQPHRGTSTSLKSSHDCFLYPVLLNSHLTVIINFNLIMYVKVSFAEIDKLHKLGLIFSP
jgi:hypothetical protein